MGVPNTLPNPARPKIITTRTCHRLVRESKKRHQQTLSELHNDVAPHASLDTVNRALASVNIQNLKWRARKRALLKDEHAVKRLPWAIEYKNWTKEDFEVVIFSDECMVEKSEHVKNNGTKTVFMGSPRAGMMLIVWACIWSRNKGPLIPIFQKSVDRFVYIWFLEDGLVDVWQEVEDTVGDPIFCGEFSRRIHIPDSARPETEQTNFYEGSVTIESMTKCRRKTDVDKGRILLGLGDTV